MYPEAHINGGGGTADWQVRLQNSGYKGTIPADANGFTQDGDVIIFTKDNVALQNGKYNKDGSVFTQQEPTSTNTTAGPQSSQAGTGTTGTTGVAGATGNGNGNAGVNGGATLNTASLFGNGFSTGGDLTTSYINAGYNIDPEKFMAASSGFNFTSMLAQFLPFGLGAIFGQGAVGRSLGNFMNAISFNFDFSSLSTHFQQQAPVNTTATTETNTTVATEVPEVNTEVKPETEEKPVTEVKTEVKTEPKEEVKTETKETPKTDKKPVTTEADKTAEKQGYTKSKKATNVYVKNNTYYTYQLTKEVKDGIEVTTGKFVKIDKFMGTSYIVGDKTYDKNGKLVGTHRTGDHAGTYATKTSATGVPGHDYGKNSVIKEGTGKVDCDAQFKINGGKYNLYIERGPLKLDETLNYGDITGTHGYPGHTFIRNDGSFDANARMFDANQDRVYLNGDGEFKGCTVTRVTTPEQETILCIKQQNGILIDFEALMRTGEKRMVTAGTFIGQG